jgi:hypothetical protein
MQRLIAHFDRVYLPLERFAKRNPVLGVVVLVVVPFCAAFFIAPMVLNGWFSTRAVSTLGFIWAPFVLRFILRNS